MYNLSKQRASLIRPLFILVISTILTNCTCPHVMTFDGVHSDYYSPGEYWIVKSTEITIQARYLPIKMTNGLAVTKIIAIGGDLLKGHKIFISADSAYRDGQPILTTFPSTYKIPGIVDMQQNGQGELLQKGRQGMALHVVHIRVEDETPEGIVIQINRWTRPSEGHYINVRIKMHAQPGQDGHCGNFNGNSADDARPAVRGRLGTTGVPPNELLFRSKTPVVQANRPDINNCEPSKLEGAKELCKKKEHKFIPSMACLIDVCFGGKGFAEENEVVRNLSAEDQVLIREEELQDGQKNYPKRLLSNEPLGTVIPVPQAPKPTEVPKPIGICTVFGD